MISVEEATARVLALATPLGTEEIPLQSALGRVLAAPVIAQLTQPPFDASAMDGYAVRSADIPGTLRLIGEAAAGHPWTGTAAPGTTIRIFTGAPVPTGYDRVVIQENVQRDGDQIIIPEAGPNLNIRLQGNDFKSGSEFFPRARLSPANLGLIAAMNVARITVSRRPRVAILAGGDELVTPGSALRPGQIVSSNDIAIGALAEEVGAETTILPIARDTEESLRQGFAAASGHDLIVTIGGASVGDHDLIAKVASDLGLQRSFYKLAMRPGKPLMAGHLNQSAMLGLPGNPVSAIVCGILFMQPLLRAMQGLPSELPLLRARLGCSLPAEGNRRHYQRAMLKAGQDIPAITPFQDQDSARLSILSEADALLVRDADDPAREAGEIVHYLPLRP